MAKLLKKVFCLSLLVILTVSSTFFSYADTEEPGVRCRVILTNLKDGSQYYLKAFEIPNMRSANNGNQTTVGFSFNTNKENIIPMTRGSQTNEDIDVSGSVSGRVKITYSTSYDADGSPKYLLTNVQGGWTINDPSGISLSDREVAYTCQDAMNFFEGNVSHPSSNSFNINTGFDHWAREETLGVLGASSHVTIRHGSESEWQMDVECNYFNNNILDAFPPGGR